MQPLYTFGFLYVCVCRQSRMYLCVYCIQYISSAICFQCYLSSSFSSSSSVSSHRLPPHLILLFLALLLLLLFLSFFFFSLRPYTIYICIKPFMYIKSYVPFYVHMKSRFNGISRLSGSVYRTYICRHRTHTHIFCLTAQIHLEKRDIISLFFFDFELLCRSKNWLTGWLAAYSGNCDKSSDYLQTLITANVVWSSRLLPLVIFRACVAHTHMGMNVQNTQCR